MTSLTERNSENLMRRTISLPLRNYPLKDPHDLRKQSSLPDQAQLTHYYDIYKNTDAKIELLNRSQVVDDFLGDKKEMDDLENLLLNISLDQSSTDAESKDEILSILNRSKKRVYSSNILDCKLLVGNSTRKKFPFYKSNSLTQASGCSAIHEVPERISKPICNESPVRYLPTKGENQF